MPLWGEPEKQEVWARALWCHLPHGCIAVGEVSRDPPGVSGFQDNVETGS